MRSQNSNNRLFWLALAAGFLLVLGAAACDGDDSSPSGPPSPVGSPEITPVVTPGSGLSPIQAVGTYISANGLDGHPLDLSPEARADCPLEEATAVPSPVPGTLTPVTRLFLGQFCISLRDYEAEKSTTVVVELPGTDEVWEMKLEFDSDLALWKVHDVDKTSG